VLLPRRELSSCSPPCEPQILLKCRQLVLMCYFLTAACTEPHHLEENVALPVRLLLHKCPIPYKLRRRQQ
jgi:hypothetical protein